MYNITRYAKSTGKKEKAYFNNYDDALYYMNSILTQYEQKKTEEMRQKALLVTDSFYSKKYTYYINEA